LQSRVPRQLDEAAVEEYLPRPFKSALHYRLRDVGAIGSGVKQIASHALASTIAPIQSLG
jgi:hypothetical protein